MVTSYPRHSSQSKAIGRLPTLAILVFTGSLFLGSLDTNHLDAQIKSLDLEMAPAGVDYSPNGSTAVFWGADLKGRDRFDSIVEADDVKKLMIIDTRNAEIVAQRDLSFAVSRAWLSDRYLYVIADNESVIYRYDSFDLENRKRIVPEGRISAICPLERDHMLVLAIPSFSSNTETDSPYRLIDEEFQMHVVDSDLPTQQLVQLWPRSPYHRLVDITRPFLQVGQNARKSALIQPFLIQELVIGNPSQDEAEWIVAQSSLYDDYVNRNHTPTQWGRLMVPDGGFTDAYGFAILPYSQGVSDFFDEHPVAVNLYLDRSREKGKLAYHSLIEGDLIIEQDLGELTSRTEATRGRALGSSVFANGEQVVASIDNMLFIADVPSEIERVAAPLHLQVAHIEPLPIDQRGTIHVRGLSGSGNEQFRLDRQVDGISIDEESGEITLDGSLIWEQAREVGQVEDDRRLRSKDSHSLAPGMRSPELFEAITGFQLPADSQAYVFELGISVTDQEGQRDHLHLYPVLIAPIKDAEDSSDTSEIR